MQKKLTVGPKGSKLYQNMDKMGQMAKDYQSVWK